MFNHFDPTELDYPIKITSELGIIRSPKFSIYAKNIFDLKIG